MLCNSSTLLCVSFNDLHVLRSRLITFKVGWWGGEVNVTYYPRSALAKDIQYCFVRG